MRTSALAALVSGFENRIRKLRAEAVAEREKAAAKLRAAKSAEKTRERLASRRLAACEGDRLRRERLYSDALRRCGKRSWWRSPGVWTVVGTVLGAGACGLATGLSR